MDTSNYCDTIDEITRCEKLKSKLNRLGLLEPAQIMILLHYPLIKSGIYETLYHLSSPLLPDSWIKIFEPQQFNRMLQYLVEEETKNDKC